MRMSKLILISLAVLALALGGVDIAVATVKEPPPPPAWVNPGGTADISKMPDRIPVADAMGNIVGYVDKNLVTNPPAGPRGSLSQDGEIPARNENGDIVGYLVSDGEPGAPLRFARTP